MLMTFAVWLAGLVMGLALGVWLGAFVVWGRGIAKGRISVRQNLTRDDMLAADSWLDNVTGQERQSESDKKN